MQQFDAIHTFSFETASAILLVSFRNRALDTSPMAAKHLQKNPTARASDESQYNTNITWCVISHLTANKSGLLGWTALIDHNQMTIDQANRQQEECPGNFFICILLDGQSAFSLHALCRYANA